MNLFALLPPAFLFLVVILTYPSGSVDCSWLWCGCFCKKNKADSDISESVDFESADIRKELIGLRDIIKNHPQNGLLEAQKLVNKAQDAKKKTEEAQKKAEEEAKNAEEVLKEAGELLKQAEEAKKTQNEKVSQPAKKPETLSQPNSAVPTQDGGELKKAQPEKPETYESLAEKADEAWKEAEVLAEKLKTIKDATEKSKVQNDYNEARVKAESLTNKAEKAKRAMNQKKNK